MPVINANGIDINYREEGSGFPLVLLHGLSETSTCVGMLMPGLTGTSIQCAMICEGTGIRASLLQGIRWDVLWRPAGAVGWAID